MNTLNSAQAQFDWEALDPAQANTGWEEIYRLNWHDVYKKMEHISETNCFTASENQRSVERIKNAENESILRIADFEERCLAALRGGASLQEMPEAMIKTFPADVLYKLGVNG